MAHGTPAASFVPEGLFLDLLEVSLTAINVQRPVYGPAGDIVDFTLVYLNPAAQRMAGLPERPNGTLLTLRPGAAEAGIFDHHRRAFETGAAEVYEVNYQAEGLDNYFRLAARRSGEWLVVSFTDTADQDRTPVEVALRAAQAAERAARTKAEAQRQRLHQLLLDLPAIMAIYRGPEHVYDLVSPPFQQLFPTRSLSGRPIREALPELAGQGLFELLDRVYQTGEPFYGQEVPTQVDYTGTGRLEPRYHNMYFQVTRDDHGAVDGLLSFAYDVTEQVLARQQVQQLNQALEARVRQRTHEAETARAEAEEERNRLLRLFGQAPAQIDLFTGPDHVWTVVHPRTQQLLPHRQLQGLPRRLALPELPPEQQEPFDRVYRTGQPVQVVETIRHLNRFDDGELHDEYFDITFQPKFDAAGRIEGVMTFALNVTERVRNRQRTEALQAEVLAAARQQVQEREAFHNVFEQTPAIIAVLREPDHRYEYVNPAYQAFFPGIELVGRTLAEALPDVASQGFGALMDKVYRTGETFFGNELPFPQPAAPGQPVRPGYYNFTYQAYREAGAIVGISIFAYDVTEQVLARQARETQRQQLQAVFTQAPVAVCVFRGEDYVFDIVNPTMGEILSQPLAALLGRPFFEVVPELRSQGLPALLAGVFRTGTPFVALEQELRLAHHAPGRPGYYNYVYEPLRADDGRVTGVVCVATDVSEQVRARQRVQELNEELQATNAELSATNEQLTRTNVDLDNFIYTASHDLKAPITNIEGLVDTLRHELPEQPPTGEVAYVLDLMQESVERFLRTIEHLTAVSKLQKEHDPPTALVALAPVLEDVRQDLAPLLGQTGGRLHLRVRECPPLRFAEKNLRSVLYNLLNNALKYRHPDRAPAVHVRCRPEAGFTVLDVQDNGLGLDLAREKQVFAMFQRLHTHVDGSGLGLYMVKRIMENAGGKITVHSQVGEGTTFSVYFPH